MNKNKLNLIELKIADELFFALKEIKNITGMPLTKIVVSILNEKIENIKELDYNRKFVEDYKKIDSDLETQIRFRINENERIFLEEQMRKTGNNSLTSEIRYRLLNTIYKNKYFLPIELKYFRDLIYQLRKIGSNINQISTKLNSNKDLNNSDISIIKNSIDTLNIKINETKDDLENILYSNTKRN